MAVIDRCALLVRARGGHVETRNFRISGAHLADRRTGHRSGWLPWAALAAGTVVSVAANVAVAVSDPVGRVVAGWPAFTLLVAVKLLSELLEHRNAGRHY
ncbi:MAG: hypothetical protein ACRDPK_00950 [Carbonactinosporaceae bacterium]